VTEHDVAGEDVAAGEAEAAPAPPPAAKAGPAGRVRSLITRHKIGTAIVALLVAAAIAGVASGSLKGTPATSSAGPDSVTYANPAAAPAFTLPALGTSPGSGTSTSGAASTAGTVSLAQYQGKPLILNFFASWCAPCQQETPLIASFYKASAGRLLIVGVDGNDTATTAAAFARAKGVSYPVGEDPQLITASAYNVAAFPQTFFLDSRHRVVFRVLGAVTQAQLEQGVRLMDSE
jgi:thiol-disulfide isomerase/thioredoxin